ncbi:MAG: metallophosphoesterase family protein [Nitrospinae bacterium]|nr:metallophosphoesterase family protein [Nitrospinota bacterium]
MTSSVRMCVLSDTHGRLAQEVVEFCQGADRILHAGDVGSDYILPELENIAPVTCVMGNVDVAGFAPMRSKIDIAGWRILVQHIVWDRGGPSRELKLLLKKEATDLVIFGHSHQPLCRMIDKTVFFNPGSCGPKRFDLPTTVGEVVLDTSGGWFRICDLVNFEETPPIIEFRFERPW